MLKQGARQPRRYQNMRRGRGKGERDPYMFVLTAQIISCIAIIAAAYALKVVQPDFWSGMTARYRILVTERQRELVPDDMLSQVIVRCIALHNEVVDAAGGLIADLTESRTIPASEPAEETSPDIEDVTSQADEDDEAYGEASWTAGKPDSHEVLKSQAASLNGMGGWMGLGAGGSKAKLAPSACDLSPMVVPAALQPPVSGKLTSVYGWREHPLNGADDFHRGVDIAAAEGSGIRTPLPGRVSVIDSSAIYGNYVTIDHGNDFFTTYCHCESVAVPLGANLRSGELVALVGNTGISTGPHVHFEIGKNEKYYNPAWVLDGMGIYGV